MVRIIAHRGARSIAPENTIQAARIAFETGADLWETDVNITRDRRLILFHDDTLIRCTDAVTRFPLKPSYRVRDFDLKDIKALDAGSHYVETDPFRQISKGGMDKKTLAGFIGERVPTLEQGLAFTLEKKWKINLELKSFPEQRDDSTLPDLTLGIIHDTQIPLTRVVVSSFNHDWLKRIMEKAPEIEVQALVGHNDRDPLDFKEFFFPAYNVNALLIRPDQIKELKARGKKINIFTVNDPPAFSRFEGLGVDGIFTDFPQIFTQKS